MQKYLPKHLAEKSIVLPEFSPEKIKNYWQGKPTSWPDIRKNAQDGHIYLLVDTRYPIGFTATATGGYSVKIDGVAYEDYTSQEQFSINYWTDYTTTEGYTIDYPTDATKAHIIDIYPQTESENITAFRMQRVAASGTEQQGILWAHFNINNAISLQEFCRGGSGNPIRQLLIEAITAKNNKILCSSLSYAFTHCQNLTYLPFLVGNTSQNYSLYETFMNCYALTKISLKDFNITAAGNMFTQCFNLQKIQASNVNLSPNGNFYSMYFKCRKLKDILPADYTNVLSMTEYLTEDTELNDTILDVSTGTKIPKIACFGSSTYFMNGFKGLRVSNEAPFTGSAPQINVSYTGMDRSALVQLFNDLPSVSAGQIINVVGTPGASDLTAEDEAIATAKGWTITK